MTDDMKKTTITYLKAFANLYGIIPVKEAQAMLTKYESKKYSIKAFAEEEKITDSDKYGFVLLDGQIVAPDVLYIDEDFYENLQKAQAGKNYAHLPKDELLKYADRDYFQKTPQYRSMTAFLADTLQIGMGDAEAIAEEIAYMCAAQMAPDRVFMLLESRDIIFTGMAQYQKFLEHYAEMANHTRLWSNCGHTPAELRKNIRPTDGGRK